MRYLIEMSHMVDVPAYVEAATIPELRRWVQDKADSKKVRSDRPAIGELSYRYNLDAAGETIVVHAYFIGSNGLKRRFMRLRREQDVLRPVADDRIMGSSNAITQTTKGNAMSDPSSPSYNDRRLFPSSSARTDLSRRREQAARDQRRMWGDVDPQGRRY